LGLRDSGAVAPSALPDLTAWTDSPDIAAGVAASLGNSLYQQRGPAQTQFCCCGFFIKFAFLFHGIDECAYTGLRHVHGSAVD
jgi:hypothetical protein